MLPKRLKKRSRKKNKNNHNQNQSKKLKRLQRPRKLQGTLSQQELSLKLSKVKARKLEPKRLLHLYGKNWNQQPRKVQKPKRPKRQRRSPMIQHQRLSRTRKLPRNLKPAARKNLQKPPTQKERQTSLHSTNQQRKRWKRRLPSQLPKQQKNQPE